MTEVTIKGGDWEQKVLLAYLIKVDLFKNNMERLVEPYELQSRVSANAFNQFVGAISGEKILITENNVNDLESLCREFGFSGLNDQIKAFRGMQYKFSCKSPKADVSVPQRRLEHLEDRVRAHSREIYALNARILNIEGGLAQLIANWEKRDRQSADLIERLEQRISDAELAARKSQEIKIRELSERISENDRQLKDFREILRDATGRYDAELESQESQKAQLIDLRRCLYAEVSNIRAVTDQQREQETSIREMFVPLRDAVATLPIMESKLANLDCKVAERSRALETAIKNEKGSRDREVQRLFDRVLKLEKCTTPSAIEEAVRQNQRKQENERIAVQNETTRFKGDPRNGIFAHLRLKCGGNIHQMHVVNITASSQYHSSGPIYKVVDSGWTGSWHTNNSRSEWVQFDFKQNRVCLTHYSLADCYGAYPKNWKLAVSNDGTSWSDIDNRCDVSTLSDKKCHAFDCRLYNPGFFKLVRLTQTGPNGWRPSGTHLHLSEVELFGAIRPI